MYCEEIKELLEEKYRDYCRADFFIETDPIQIPKMFEIKEDIEIAGFLAATLAWGQRTTIIKKSKDLMLRMDYSPYDFVLNATKEDLKQLDGFVHRTFNDYDCKYFIQALSLIYREYSGLEGVFTQGFQQSGDMFGALEHWFKIFTSLPYEKRVLRHISDVKRGSAAKRVNMFMRWMVRKDNVDFGLWHNIPTSALLIPLDLHSGNISRQLGLLTRRQNDRKAVEELTANLIKMDPVDPIKYDFALFGLGAFSRK